MEVYQVAGEHHAAPAAPLTAMNTKDLNKSNAQFIYHYYENTFNEKRLVVKYLNIFVVVFQ